MFCIEHGWTIASVFCVHYIYMHYKHIASERAIVFRTFAVSVYCWMAMHFFQAVRCIEPKHCETILNAYTQFNAHLLRWCVLSNRLNEFFSNLNTVFVQKITWKWLKKSQTESMRSIHFSYEQRICLSMAVFFSRLMYFFDFDFYKRKPCVWRTFNDIEKSYINNKHIHQPR